MKRTMRLDELVIDDELLRLRPINEVMVSRYRQAYRNGSDLGTPIVDKETGIVVSGNHRVTAMRQEFGEDHECVVDVQKFPSRAAIIERFARENVQHGMPLSGASRRAITLELLRLDVPEGEIANLFGVSVKRIEEWAEMSVVVVGKKGEPNRTEPIKHGLEIAGQRVKKKDYDTHWQQDRGVPVHEMSEQLARWMRNDWIPRTDHNRALLGDLKEALDKWLEE